MSAAGNAERIGIIGMGAIGQTLARGVARQWPVPLAALIRDPDKARSVPSGIEVFTTTEALLRWRPTLVIECAGHAAVAGAVPVLLRNGVDVTLVSVGALADDALRSALADASRAGQSALTWVSGAIGGLDALSAARAGGLSSVRYTGRKPPLAWIGTLAEKAFDLAALDAPAVIYRGNAAEAARLYPKNANVTAAVALAGVGFANTGVEMVADPSITR